MAFCLPEGLAVIMEIEAAATLLASILSKRGIETTVKQLIKLFKLGQWWDHFKDVHTLFSITEWQEFGEIMWQKTIEGDEKLEKEIKAVQELWRTVLETLKAMKAEREVACAAAQMLTPEPAPEKLKGAESKSGPIARLFGLPAVKGMTGSTCKTVTELRSRVDPRTEKVELILPPPTITPEVAGTRPKQKCEQQAELQSQETKEEEWPSPPTPLPPPYQGREKCQPIPMAPPLYPPLPPSSSSSPTATLPPREDNVTSSKKTDKLLNEVVQQIKELSARIQQCEKNPSGVFNLDESSLPCLSGPPAATRPGRWSGIVRDAILEGQWGVAASMGPMAFPVVQENRYGKWEPHDWKILQQVRNTISQYGVKSEATRQIVSWIFLLT